MFKIESYVTPILLSYVDKYVRDFKPADAQVSLWGGGVALHNLVLKADVLQQEVALPFTLVSGRIHELLIQVPWTKIMSEPIVVTIDTIECVLSLNPPTSPDGSPPTPSSSRKAQVVEAPPGYMQALVRRIVSNISLRVHHLIVKYVQDDIVMSLNVKHLAVNSAGPNWEPAFADIDQVQPMIRRLVRLDDLTLCLDRSDVDGKIRFFQEPILYRCQLDLRVLTRLVSANTRRATSLNIQLRSSKLAWSVTNEQLVLLLRLIKERPMTNTKIPPPPKQSAPPDSLNTASSNSAEPNRSESWSEWAWSWLPTWTDREPGVEEPPVLATALPIYFNAYFDDVALVFKVLELDSNRKRSRAVLEVSANYAALKSSICNPTYLRVRFGARELTVRSHGKCICGYLNYHSSNFEPTVYLHKIADATTESNEEWTWPEEDMGEKVETGVAVDETYQTSSSQAAVNLQQNNIVPEGDSKDVEDKTQSGTLQDDKAEHEEVDELWAQMAPIVFVEYIHERAAPNPLANPYENPPKDFEYSDWVEECTMAITVEPIELRVCMGLIHRLGALKAIYKEQMQNTPDQPKRVLTVEEKESLYENLPQKRVKMEMRGVRVRIIPWGHGLTDRPAPPAAVLEVDMPKTSAVVVAPMYPHRVCSAASQMPEDSGPLWQGARRNTTITLSALSVKLTNAEGTVTRPCAQADLKVITRQLLYKKFFEDRDSIALSYHVRMKEMKMYGSSARLQTAYNVVMSLVHERRSVAMKYTTLAKDALNDEESVAIDLTLEDYAMRGYATQNVNTHVVSLQSAKITALHEPKTGEMKQAWLLSAPDASTTTPFFRLAIQWCAIPLENSFDYCGIWTEPFAMSVDPLLLSWLAYLPTSKSDASTICALKGMSSMSQNSFRRRSTPPSSSGRGGSRTNSARGAELVHMRSRSQGSSSEPSEKKEVKMPVPMQSQPAETWWTAEKLADVYKRLKGLLLSVELGLALVYVTMSTASAIDCATLRDAMDRHAAGAHRVLAISLGRLSMCSSGASKQLWQALRHDGPTFIKGISGILKDSFPWKLALSDVSCHTLEVCAAPVSSEGHEKPTNAGLKSNLRTTKLATAKTILELVSTTVTISVVTKSVQYKTVSKKETKKSSAVAVEEKKTKYFTSGTEFKPSTLREFIRGPAGRKKKSADSLLADQAPEDADDEVVTITEGPIVSLGVHVHADTPPIIIRLEQDQLHIVAAAIHCFTHINTLMKRPPVNLPRPTTSSMGGSHKSLIRSVSDIEEVPSVSEDLSDAHSELISIFDRAAQRQRPLKTFFWFQWVVSRATLIVASETVKLALDMDDMILTIDIQQEYNQLKIKLASASIKHYKRDDNDEWVAGVMSGRVLEVREPAKAEEDAHFLTVTVTQAQVSNLPPGWKEELHPKLLEQTNMSDDVVWEVYATLAPLEALIQPDILDNVMSLVREMAPRAFCPLKAEIEKRDTVWQWPYFYLTAGGIRVLITGEHLAKEKNVDDTIILSIGSISVNPHPENPICRRTISATPDGGWQAAAGAFEGRQYEVVMQTVALHSTQFKEMTQAESVSAECKGTGSENPALKWSQRIKMPDIVPILHPLEVCCVLAPALYVSGVLASGPAIEFNLVSDCSFEFGVEQLVLLDQFCKDFVNAAQTDYISVGSVQAIDKHGVCPYANLIMSDLDFYSASETTVDDTVFDHKVNVEAGRTCDSGIETIASSSKTKTTDDAPPLRRSFSVGFVENPCPSQFLEVFVTMGVVEVSLYIADDNSPEVGALRPPVASPTKPASPEPSQNVQDQPLKLMESATRVTSRSLTEMVRDADVGQTLIDTQTTKVHARRGVGNVPLAQITMYQPNIYYWKRKTQKTLQLSLFNAWIALAAGGTSMMLLSTAKGVPDPVSDIPPALATFKVVAPVSSMPNPTSTSSRGTMRLDIEKPVQIDLSKDKLTRVIGISDLLRARLFHQVAQEADSPPLYKLKNRLVREGMESVTIHTSQISVAGAEGIVGWDSASLQISASARPEKVNARGLITALLVASGPPGDRRHVVLQPLIVGVELQALWEAWRRAEGGMAAREPTVKINIELDDVTVDIRPIELATYNRLLKVYQQIAQNRSKSQVGAVSSETVTKSHSPSILPRISSSCPSMQNYGRRPSPVFIDDESSDHFYKDDLRSGAFKILSGGQFPMAYQVMLYGNAVSWRYPHPRAITRVVAFPIPGQDKEIDCVLELYNSMLVRWEAHTFFKLPTGEPRELRLFVRPPETVFAIMWRFRVCSVTEPKAAPFEFDMNKFMPRSDPLVLDEPQFVGDARVTAGVSAEELLGVLRVDSYFAPRLLPRITVALRLARLQVHAHNSLPDISSHETFLEGYYVSKPLMKTHRVLSFTVSNTAAYAHINSPAGTLLVMDTNTSSDMVDCATGTMEPIMQEFRVQGAISAHNDMMTGSRCRVMTTGIHVAMHVSRLRTLQALFNDWKTAYDEYVLELPPRYTEELPDTRKHSRHEIAAAMALALEGRVVLWIHNSCASAMRIGQEDTDEVVPLGPGARLAYRWRNPTASRRLRIALAGPTADWHWSASIPFAIGTTRLKIETPESVNNKQFASMGAVVHVKVEQLGACRYMHLSGRLVLANMLRATLLYKVKSRLMEGPQWRTVCSGELAAETVGRSVICSADNDMVLKIKFRSHNTCWSGDIPLKECPKENVPWLVKVPTEGESQFVSIWCRVVRGRADGRILATLWPLYILHSHLPLDTDVLIVTEAMTTTSEDLTPVTQQLPPMLQTTPGRGSSTHLQAPGTTAARHSLSFQYRNIECPVTREAVPLHYGVTDTSVFDKRTPVMNIEDVITDVLQWLERSSRNANSAWPYSLVAKHWGGDWQPASLQPRCDVAVRYQAVRAGGGCSLEILLSPIVLLCNATPIPLTLRAYDAAPLCKLEPGSALSPPSAIIKKPFFMSVEVGRETFVSCQLQVATEEPGRYGTLPPGQVALDHPANFSILCNQKVALLTLYYEIKEQINVLGVSSTYLLVNRLGTEVLVSAIAVPSHMDDSTMLRPKTFKVVPPSKEGSEYGTSLCRFWLRGRWRGCDPIELRAYLCFALPATTFQGREPVPIRLGHPPLRRAMALVDSNQVSIPIVVSQIRHDSRWMIVIAHDPCPQFLVHNHTRLTLQVAEPVHSPDEPSTSRVEPITECAGTTWWCTVLPNSAVHYSTPSYCARYPPETMPPSTVSSPYLTFSKGKELDEDWCPPVIAVDGEQLIQYYGGITIKLRVRTHPHSTLIELQDVDHNDISASDIRKRLLGAFEAKPNKIDPSSSACLERTGADCKLLSDSPARSSSTRIDTTRDAANEGTSSPKQDSDSVSEDENLTFKFAQSVEKMIKRSGETVTMFVDPSKALDYSSANMYAAECHSQMIHATSEVFSSHTSVLGEMDDLWAECERFRCVIAGIAVEVSSACDIKPLLALHLDRTVLLVQGDSKKTKTILSIADAQIDNLQYDTGQYDFAVVASTRAEPLAADRWPPLWNMFAERNIFSTRAASARLLFKLQHDKWEVVSQTYSELTEVEISLGTLALYIEDAYVKALVDMSHMLLPASTSSESSSQNEERSIRKPLRLRLLHVHPLDLTLTLHTAVRMYIALDQSPLRLSAFKLHDMMTSAERLTHALTVHYLSAAILGAGWVVGGLELLGAPGALAARLGGATGGVRGVASAAAAALLRSLSAWAGSLARNLDLLAGDEEHARRAAAARRRPPPSFVAGLMAGITNFAINILGAVGGLAHHPLVGVAVGETESGAAALRRGLLGALTKPLSATADLVAYAGSGLLRQTGWDPVPEPRHSWPAIEPRTQAGWQRDCVRWMFRLCELTAFTGFEVLLDKAPLQLLITHKFLVVADPESERVVETIDFRFCSLGPYKGEIIELCVLQKRHTKTSDSKPNDDDEDFQISAAAMARVARYTGSEGAQAEVRVLTLLPPPGRSYALHAALAAALHHNADTHFPML
nr:intermembrane lipid transfer protein VPS13B isoform X1 [Helicoverpa armigera]XP_049694095.1 intermembrane lipid transfer protein VPS13B isoform X1 [Helicoverpa armigera]